MDENTLKSIFGTEFTRAGDNYKGRCPFHQERSPSFYVHSSSFLANCFGCGTSGRIDKLVAEYCAIRPSDAREKLGISLQDTVSIGRSRDRKVLQTIYPESWLAPYGREVHKYVVRRGFMESALREAETRYDRSLRRQVFPHRNGNGELIGAAGRSVCEADPKWYFYWGYHKGQNLYRVGSNLHVGTQALILVEGIFDALWFWQNGYTNVAATLGTKFTQAQVREVKSLTDHVYLAFDNDAAGQEATKRFHTRLKHQIDLSFCSYPQEFKDPVGMTKDQLDTMIHTALTPLQFDLAHKARLRSENEQRRKGSL